MARAFLLCLLSCFFANTIVAQKRSSIYHRITRIIDGDTFWINDGSAPRLKIRLIGVDAPELKTESGDDAKANLSNLIAGKKVRIKYDTNSTDLQNTCF